MTEFIDYSQGVSYICLVFSLCALLGGAAVGVTSVCLVAAISIPWTNKVREPILEIALLTIPDAPLQVMATRGRIWCILVVLAYPAIATTTGTILCMIGEQYYNLEYPRVIIHK